MTYKEKWEQDNPDSVFSPYVACPDDGTPECGYVDCSYCWNREIGAVTHKKSEPVHTAPRKSKWLISSDLYYPYCPKCLQRPPSDIMTKYCPNCGESMNKED